ncbi:Mtc1 family protein [Alkalihalophilus marmarensis]|uniref:Mtc1 family protein n=1 Tax=Alkalihalophilus marmarensis TaxID=521377 RepID=UPI00203E4AB3|nr:Mtc1 family protein [Alkalihalophilus marmarensis]MCM3488803.1 Mtc1 family protein [Alkalihalophilus marmarensis]
MITKLAVWWLRKRKVSMVLGFIIDGPIVARENHLVLYNNKHSKDSIVFSKAGDIVYQPNPNNEVGNE